MKQVRAHKAKRRIFTMEYEVGDICKVNRYPGMVVFPLRERQVYPCIH